VNTENRNKISIPYGMLPSDGRFGAGPSKVRREQIDVLVSLSVTLLGSSHRQEPVKNLMAAIKSGLKTLFALPDGWEVLFGNGGASFFWDAASFGLIRNRSEHLVFGEFSAKFADIVSRTPHLDTPLLLSAPAGDAPLPVAGDVDAYCFTHNETSTGVRGHIGRPDGDTDALVVVDATSAAGCMPWDTGSVDVYYFSPHKGFGADGGTWVALCSPRAVSRIVELGGSGRWCPPSLDLGVALTNSRVNQTYNTQSVTTMILLNEQIRWMLSNGGLGWCTERVGLSSGILYDWADSHDAVKPFVTNRALRSPVVVALNFKDVDAAALSRILRDNGILDVEPYRKIGGNQLRVSVFPSVEPDDVSRLVTCMDYLIGRMG